MRQRARVLSVAPFIVAVLLSGCDGPAARHYARLDARTIALSHVRTIDGTGRPANADQTIVIQDGRINAAGPFRDVAVPAGALIVDLSGRTVLPGLVGMHEHLFYQVESPSSGVIIAPAQAAFTKLYLAAGVTTIRTAGTADFEGDLRIKRLVDGGRAPGPKIHITGPYLNAVGSAADPAEIRREVLEAADEGATSFKAYTTLRSAELKAAIDAAHERGFRVTGHLCAVGFHEAIALGIDNVEHGILFDTDLYSGKQPDVCPDQSAVFGEILQMDITHPAVQRTITDLVTHGVAVTSTLAVIDGYTGFGPAIDPRVPMLLSSRLQTAYREARGALADPHNEWPRVWSRLLKKEMDFERMFVRTGGRLLAGVDPTGWGGTVAGFGDQRELELLVAAGLSPEEAVRVATANGAAFLDERDIGTIAVGNRADLVVVRGDPTVHMSDVRDVELVFKDGVGYDPASLVEAARGSISQYDFTRVLRWPWNAALTVLLAWLATKKLWRRRRRAMLQAARV